MLTRLIPSPTFEMVVALLDKQSNPNTRYECTDCSSARVVSFPMSLGLAGNRPGFRIREDAKASDLIRENVQGKPSRIPHEESSELFEIGKEREQFEGKGRRDA